MNAHASSMEWVCLHGSAYAIFVGSLWQATSGVLCGLRSAGIEATCGWYTGSALLYQTERIRVICQVVRSPEGRAAGMVGQRVIRNEQALGLLLRQAVVAKGERRSCRYSASSCSVQSTSKEACTGRLGHPLS